MTIEQNVLVVFHVRFLFLPPKKKRRGESVDQAAPPQNGEGESTPPPFGWSGSSSLGPSGAVGCCATLLSLRVVVGVPSSSFCPFWAMSLWWWWWWVHPLRGGSHLSTRAISCLRSPSNLPFSSLLPSDSFEWGCRAPHPLDLYLVFHVI